MKQYCRYCAHLTVGDVAWCSIKQKTLSEGTTKTVNSCKDYADCNICAYTLMERKERKNHVIEPLEGQCSLIDYGGR